MIELLLTSFRDQFPAPVFSAGLDSLPPEMAGAVLRYRRWQDRQRALLGKLLLRRGLRACGWSGDPLRLVCLDRYGRPSIDPELDFNISHSGNFVVCALARKQRVGIDLEEIRPLELSDFESAFTPAQWSAIRQAPDRYLAFFNCWTQKESVLKGDGRGLSLALSQVELGRDGARVGDEAWKLVSLAIHPAYCCHLATTGSPNFTLTEISSSELLAQSFWPRASGLALPVDEADFQYR